MGKDQNAGCRNETKSFLASCHFNRQYIDSVNSSVNWCITDLAPSPLTPLLSYIRCLQLYLNSLSVIKYNSDTSFLLLQMLLLSLQLLQFPLPPLPAPPFPYFFLFHLHFFSFTPYFSLFLTFFLHFFPSFLFFRHSFFLFFLHLFSSLFLYLLLSFPSYPSQLTIAAPVVVCGQLYTNRALECSGAFWLFKAAGHYKPPVSFPVALRCLRPQ